MKPAIVVAAAVLVGSFMISGSIDRLRRTIASQPRNVMNMPKFPSQITVVPQHGGFRVTGDGFQGAPQQGSSGGIGNEEAFAKVSNVWLVESRVTPEQLAAAPRTLVGRWRDENSYAEYRADQTCTWTGDNGRSNTYQWRLEGDTLFETHTDGHKVQRRILELDDKRFVYQQFPAGSIWRATRADDFPQVEKSTQ
jgi:hypothetical protein